MNSPNDFSRDIRPDASDLGIKREQLMFDGQRLDDPEYVVYGCLHSQKAGNPRMTLDEIYKQLWTFRSWRACKGDCLMVARKMREFGWAGITEDKVKYRIKRMAMLGYFHNLAGLPRIP